VSLYLTSELVPPSNRLVGFPQTRISENKYICIVKDFFVKIEDSKNI
jgi:hypothetical protein